MAQIRHQIVIEARPEKVFPLVATGTGFREWWAADVIKSLTTVELGFFKRATVYRLELTRVSGPHEAEWRCLSGKEWEGTRIVFDLKEDNGKTVLRFTHTDWKAETDYFVSCTTTWGELMFRLKAAAEGKKPGPLFSADGMAY